MKPYVQVNGLIQESGILLCTEECKEFHYRQMLGANFLLTYWGKQRGSEETNAGLTSTQNGRWEQGPTILRTLCSTPPWPPHHRSWRIHPGGCKWLPLRKAKRWERPLEVGEGNTPSSQTAVLTRSLPSRPRGHQTWGKSSMTRLLWKVEERPLSNSLNLDIKTQMPKPHKDITKKSYT